MALRQPSKHIKRMFGNFEEMQNYSRWLFMEPNGVYKMYFLVDKETHELFTNVITNDQGEVCTTNWTEIYTNFTVDEDDVVRLGTKMHVDEDKGIAVAWYRR